MHFVFTDNSPYILFQSLHLYSDFFNILIIFNFVYRFGLITQVFVNPVGICWCLGIREMNGKSYLIAGVRENEVDIMDIQTLKLLSSTKKHHWGYLP